MSFISSFFFFFFLCWEWKVAIIQGEFKKSLYRPRKNGRIRKDLKRPRLLFSLLIFWFTETVYSKTENTGKRKCMIFRVTTLLDSYVYFPKKKIIIIITRHTKKQETISHSREKMKQQKLSLRKTCWQIYQINTLNNCLKDVQEPEEDMEK